MFEHESMDKRTNVISIRVSPELDETLKRLAADQDMTVSSIGYQLLVQYVQDQRLRYLQLKNVFGADQGLPRDTPLPPT